MSSSEVPTCTFFDTSTQPEMTEKKTRKLKILSGQGCQGTVESKISEYKLSKQGNKKGQYSVKRGKEVNIGKRKKEVKTTLGCFKGYKELYYHCVYKNYNMCNYIYYI